MKTSESVKVMYLLVSIILSHSRGTADSGIMIRPQWLVVHGSRQKDGIPQLRLQPNRERETSSMRY